MSAPGEGNSRDGTCPAVHTPQVTTGLRAQSKPNPTGSPDRATRTWFTCLLEVCPSLIGGSLLRTPIPQYSVGGPDTFWLSTGRTKAWGLHQRAPWEPILRGEQRDQQTWGWQVPGRGRNNLGKCQDREWSPEYKSKRGRGGSRAQGLQSLDFQGLPQRIVGRGRQARACL
jgi:hypothetical protein